MTRLIGLDIGDARTGIALSDEVGLTARALETVPTDSLGEAVKKVVAEHDVTTVVVGRPRHLDGSLGTQAEKIDVIVETLKLAAPAEYIYEDETGTTKAAADGTDAEAARVMLQGYLDERAR
ncbi:Holliday junction resolvase RuvX [Patescibacteria group bacterium]|nr:Holliday junction resolvase RuvX [Patescibacteria group bacterium]